MPRLRRGLLVRVRADAWRIRHIHRTGDVVVLDVAGAGAENAGTMASFLAPFEAVQPLPASSTTPVVRPHRWRRNARRRIAAVTPSPWTLRAAARARIDVLPYQLEPALALAGGHASRLLVADEVGLGKTIQAGLAIAELLAREPAARTLVVCPAGLRHQWDAELRVRFAVEATMADAAGLAAAGTGLDPGVTPWAAGRVAITSIDYLKRTEVIGGLDALIWDLVVFDEAHHLAGDSRRAAAAAALAARARRVLLLTATPHAGDAAHFERLCDIGRLPGDAPLLVFRRRRADVSLPTTRRERPLRVRPTAAERAMHAALAVYARTGRARTAVGSAARLLLSLLMRRACSSAWALGRSVERRLALLGRSDTAAQIPLPLPDADDPDELDPLLSLPLLEDATAERSQLERLATLARRASLDESKLAAITRLLRRRAEPVLLFTEYRDTLARAARGVGDADTRLLHGEMTVAERARAVRDFTEGRTRLLIATDAGGEGLNLQARCRLVVNLEVPWSPRRLEQRIGRVDRLGQTRTVHAVHLIARATDEERVFARLATRRAFARDALHTITGTAARIDEPTASGSGATGTPAPPAPPHARISAAAPDLRAAAVHAAAWIHLVRTLDTGDEGPDVRPAATLLPARRRPRAAGTALSVWSIAIVGADGRPLWDTLTAIWSPVRVERRTPAALRLALGRLPPGGPAALRAACRAVLAAARRDLTRAAVRQLTREDAIVEHLAGDRRRLATAMAQAGLFDRRAQRQVAASDARIQQALEQCGERRLALMASMRPRTGGLSLVLSVVWA